MRSYTWGNITDILKDMIRRMESFKRTCDNCVPQEEIDVLLIACEMASNMNADFVVNVRDKKDE